MAFRLKIESFVIVLQSNSICEIEGAKMPEQLFHLRRALLSVPIYELSGPFR